MPNCFVSPAQDEQDTTVRRIGELARGLDTRDALLIFPEGGNFTERRRVRAIRSLCRGGERARADRARHHRYVLPPRTAGALAALSAAPGADVVFVAHPELDTMDSIGAVWRSLPLHHPARARWWRIPAHEVPEGPAAREAWLLGQWDRVDAWVERLRTTGS
jgi:1-acyl-sn-glycerol-3-phosphate acyltransferase